MAEKTSTLYPDSIELTRVYADVTKKEKVDSPTLEADVTSDLVEREYRVCLKLIFHLMFDIEMDVVAIYDVEDLPTDDDQDVIKLIAEYCYPIYSKIMLVLAVVMDQMDATPFILPFISFQEMLKNSKKVKTTKRKNNK